VTYTPKYTSEAKIEAELQCTISESSNPTTAQVLVWIEEIETEIDTLGLGQLTASNVTIDVPEELEQEQPPVGTIAWFEEITKPYTHWKRTGRLVFPELSPVIAVSSVYRRISGLGSIETWELLTEGLANDFIVLQGRTKAGLRGYAFYFFEDLPSPGIQRVKATYTYGLGLATAILSEYATWLVALRVLFAKSGTSNPSGTQMFSGGGLQSYVSTQYREKATQLLARIEAWEKQWKRFEVAVRVW